MFKQMAFVAVASAAALTILGGSVALASNQANSHSVVAVVHSFKEVHGHRTACTTLLQGDPNGSHTRFHASPITNTCNDQFRALAICQGRTGGPVEEKGPWTSGYGTSNTSPCPANTVVIQGGGQYPRHGSHTYCLWGCSARQPSD